MNIYVNEIFKAVQGEGPGTGTPSIFVRLAGCNLTCDWCDSKFTWHKEHIERALKFSPIDLAAEISKMPGIQNVIFTGGEPMMQQAAVLSTIYALPDNYSYEIETNGTYEIDNMLAGQIKHINISPKLKSSECDSKRYDGFVLKKLAMLPNTYWKFVISDTIADLEEIQLKYYHRFNLSVSKIYLMPEGITLNSQIEKGRAVIDLCLRYGYQFSPRIHILMYGNERRR